MLLELDWTACAAQASLPVSKTPEHRTRLITFATTLLVYGVACTDYVER